MLNFDRFSQGLDDAQAAPVVAHCSACSLEIYDADLVYSMPGGDIIHGSEQCLADYADAQLMSAEEALGVGV